VFKGATTLGNFSSEIFSGSWDYPVNAYGVVRISVNYNEKPVHDLWVLVSVCFSVFLFWRNGQQATATAR